VLSSGGVFGQRTFASCNNDSYKQQITSIGMLCHIRGFLVLIVVFASFSNVA
jgi:hypothetical protein